MNLGITKTLSCTGVKTSEKEIRIQTVVSLHEDKSESVSPYFAKVISDQVSSEDRRPESEPRSPKRSLIQIVK